MPDFDDPFKPSDATVMRPRPGAGRRGSPDAATGMSPMRPPSAPVARFEPIPDSAFESLGIGLNPLVRAASPLLLLAGQLRGTLAGPEVSGLRRHALDQIRKFEQRAKAAGISTEVVGAARYALCAGLDEAVLSTPWGAQSEWATQTLLVALHREAWGGEKFFEMLDKISKDPERHIDLMELQYLCIAMGFAGKYHAMPQGQSRLADVQQHLYREIRNFRGMPRTELSLKWKGVEDRRNPLIRYVPWWVVGAAALAILAVTFGFYYAWLARAASPVRAALSQVGLEGFSQSGPVAPVSGPTWSSTSEEWPPHSPRARVRDRSCPDNATTGSPDCRCDRRPARARAPDLAPRPRERTSARGRHSPRRCPTRRDSARAA